MKKIILITISIIMCLNVFAQEVKSGLLVGFYNGEKKDNCIDRNVFFEHVKDNADYIAKKANFNAVRKGKNPIVNNVKYGESVIVYEHQRKSGKCNSKVMGLIKGKNIEDCERKLAEHVSKNPKSFDRQPTITKRWNGNEYRDITQ